MKTYDLMKKYLAGQVMEQILFLLAKNPERNLVTLVRIVETIAPTPSHREQISIARKAFEDKDHVWTKYAVRALKQMHPNFRTKGLINLFVNEMYLGFQERAEYAKKNEVQVPALIVISPTMRCNLQCPGCYAGKYTKQPELEFELLDRVVGEAKEMGIYFIVISGGEPFIRQDLLDLAAKHDDVAFMVYTNGTLIDKAMAERLAQLGNLSPAISIEGFEKETDARRGPGTFKRIMEAMDYLREAGVIFGFSVTYTRNNTEVVAKDEFIDLMIDKGALYGWFFTFVPVGKDPDMNLMCTPEQRNYMRERVVYFRTTRPIFVADFWNDGSLAGGCLAGGRSYLHINAHGDVEPCVFVHFAVDNIRHTTLKEVLKSPFFMEIKKRMPLNENHLRPCMIIDNPHILREVVSLCGARPTHEGAEYVTTVLAGPLDEYAREYGKIADGVWARALQKEVTSQTK